MGWIGLMSQMSLIGRMGRMSLIGLACLLIQKLLTPNSFYILYMLSPMVAGGSFQFWWELRV